MSTAPFRRSPTWSSAYALTRIATKRRAVEKRLAQISESVLALQAEHEDLERVRIELDNVQRVEEGRLEQRAKGRQQLLDGVDALPQQPDPAGPTAPLPAGDSFPVPVRILERSVSQSGQAGSYEEERCLFVTSPETLHLSTHPRRIDATQPAFDDPLFRRVVKILEMPGLLHMMVLAERSQVVIDPDSFDVPDACLGLPLADAYVDQVFSLDALKALSDPEKADAFLAKVIREEID